MSMSVLEPDIDVETYIERLLNTIDRLHVERDSLRCDVEFLESESRFTIEALETKLSASISSASDKSVTTISQQDVQEEFNNTEGRYTTLQFDQLSNMTISEATRNLWRQIEEFENSVKRSETLERNTQSVEDEKFTMRQQIIELEAEVQRSKSLNHYLKIQLKDR